MIEWSKRGALARVALVLACGAAHAQTTWYVDVNGVPPGSGSASDPYTSIQYAIDRPATLDGDTLIVASGEYFENVVLASKGLTIVGVQGAEATVLDGGGAGRVFTFGNAGATPSRLEGFTITNGFAQQGGGIGVFGGAPTIAACQIRGNEAGQIGGGIAVQVASPTLSRCIVSDNTAPAGAGVYTFYGFDFLIEHCTIARNSASVHGGGLFNGVFCDPEVVNTIVWDNEPDSIHQDLPSAPVVRYSDVEGGWSGTGNIEVDPKFWGAAAGNFYLQPDSDCIDAGDPNSAPDPDGTRADIGALPADATKCGPTGVYCAAKTSSLGCTPAIRFSGVPSASVGSTFLIEADQIVGAKIGLLLYGYDWQTVPFQGGLLCLRPPIRRTPPQHSGGTPGDCSGAYSLDFNAVIQGGGDANLSIGSTNFAQYWYRDGGASFGTGLTDAVRFTICP